MARAQIYNQANHSVIIDGIPVEDFADGDDPITVIYGDTKTVLSDGLDISRLSISSRKSGGLILKLKPTSPTCDQLDRKINQYRDGSFEPFDCTMQDGVKEIHRFNRCGVDGADKVTGGGTMQMRTYTLLAEEHLPQQGDAEVTEA